MKVCDLGKAAAALRGKEGGEKTGNTVQWEWELWLSPQRGIVAKSALLSCTGACSKEGYIYLQFSF